MTAGGPGSRNWMSRMINTSKNRTAGSLLCARNNEVVSRPVKLRAKYDTVQLATLTAVKIAIHFVVARLDRYPLWVKSKHRIRYVRFTSRSRHCRVLMGCSLSAKHALSRLRDRKRKSRLATVNGLLKRLRSGPAKPDGLLV